MALYIVIRSERFKFDIKARYLIACLLLVTTISALISGNIISSFTGDTGRFAGVVTLFSLVIVSIFHSQFDFQEFRTLIAAYISTTAIVALVAISQHFSLIELPGVDGVTATFGNQDFFAAYLGISMPMYYFFSVGATRKVRVLLLAVVLVSIYSLILSGPLQSYVDIAITLFGAALFSLRRFIPRRSISLNARTFLGTFGIIIWAEIIFLTPFLGSWIPVLGNDLQVKIRANFWLAGIREFFDHPWLGVGPDQYGSYYEKYRTLSDAKNYEKILTNDAHSASVQTLATLGIFGTLTFLLLLALVIRSLLIQWDSVPGRRPWHFALGLFFFVYLTNSFISPMTVPSKFLFWGLAGWVIGQSYLNQGRRIGKVRAQTSFILILIVFIGSNFASAQWTYSKSFERYAENRGQINSYTFNPYLPCFMYFEGAFNINERQKIGQIEQLAKDQVASNPRCVSARILLAQIYERDGNLVLLKEQLLSLFEVAPTRVQVLRMGLDYANNVGDANLYTKLSNQLAELGYVYAPGKSGG